MSMISNNYSYLAGDDYTADTLLKLSHQIKANILVSVLKQNLKTYIEDKKIYN